MASISVPEIKVILVGEYGSGKSSLFRRFCNDSFLDTSHMTADQARQSTLGMDHYSRKFDTGAKGSDLLGPSPGPGRAVKIQLWDTGGLERVGSMTTSYYKFADAALLVFSIDCLHSFHSLSKHLVEVLNYAESTKIYLVANRIDVQPHEVSDDDIKDFLEEFPYFSGVYRISCKTGVGVAEMFTDLASNLASNNYMSAFEDTFRLTGQNSSNFVNLDELADYQASSGCCAK